MKRVVALAVLAAVAAVACTGGSSGSGDEPLVVPVEGTVTLIRGDDANSVTEPVPLRVGDVVAAESDGRARVVMPGRQTVELAPESSIEVQRTGEPSLMRGSVLVEATSGLDIPLGEIAVHGENAVFRLSRGLVLQVGVYAGSVRILGSTFEAEVPPLRRITVLLPTGAVNRGPRPLDVRPNHFDAWDARVLGPAIDIGLGLQRLRDGIAAQLPGRGRRTVVEHILPGRVRDESSPEVLRGGPAPDVLVAAAVSVSAVRAALDRDIETVMRDTLELRSLGASWILVAAEWALTATALGFLARLSGVLVDLLSGSSLAELLARLQPPAPPGTGGGPPPGEGPPQPPPPPPGDECTIPEICPPNVEEPPEPPPVPPEPPENPICTVDLLCDLIDDILDPPPEG